MTRKRRVTEPVHTIHGRLTTYDKIAPLLDEREVGAQREVNDVNHALRDWRGA